MKSPSAPAAPDPKETAAAQGAVNKETAIAQARLNMFDETNPWGSVRYRAMPSRTAEGTRAALPVSKPDPRLEQAYKRYDELMAGPMDEQTGYDLTGTRSTIESLGGDVNNRGAVPPETPATPDIPGMEVPRYERIVELSPEQQRLMDIEQAMGLDLAQLGSEQIGRIRGAVSDPFTFDGMPAAPTASDEGRQRIEDALYNSQRRFLDPRFDDERQNLENTLINQGFQRGTEGFRREMDDYARRRDSAYGDARDRSIMGGGQEMSRIFGLEANARERAIQEALALRSLPINETTALMGAGPGVQMPQFTPPPQTGVAPADYQGAVMNQYAGNLAAANAAQQARSSTMGSIFGLGGSALGGFLGGPGGAMAGRFLFGG